jgi:hypothetical protein
MSGRVRSGVSDEAVDRLLAKIDAAEVSFGRTIARVRRQAFWMGWATGAIPTWIIWWLTS